MFNNVFLAGLSRFYPLPEGFKKILEDYKRAQLRPPRLGRSKTQRGSDRLERCYYNLKLSISNPYEAELAYNSAPSSEAGLTPEEVELGHICMGFW